MASKFRGVKWNNARFPSTIKIRRSIDLAELGDFGSIDSDAIDLPTSGAVHRDDTKGSKSGTRQYVDLRTIQGQYSNVVDTQDMGSIGDATTAHRVWSAMGAITDIVTEAPTGILDSAATSGGGSTQYDYTDVTAVTKSLEVEFYSNNPTGGYVNVGDRVAANSTHAFFLEGRQGYSEFILSAVNLTTGTTDYTISPDQSNIPDNGIVANDSYVLISTGNSGKLYSTSTQQLVGTIPTHTSHALFKMTDNYVATMSSNDINQIDVRELDPANNFPLVNSFTGSSSEQFGQSGRFDLSDTHIVIGAPLYTSDYQATDYQESLGKAEVFNIQSGALEHTFYGRDGIHHTSTASSTTIRFGNRIAIDGDNVAINTRGSNRVAEGFRVYNYKTGELVTVGNRPTYGTDSSRYLNDLGNEAFAASGGLVFLYTGDLRDGSTYSPNQAVFVYNYSGEMVLRIDDPDISTAGQYYEYTYFGKSLAVSGDKLILGARSYSTNTDAGGAQTAIGYQVGKGYVYDLTKTYAEV